MFLTVSILLAEQISSDNTVCAAPGGQYLTTPPCQTIYAALACAIVTWVLFGISFSIDLHSIIRNKRDTEKVSAGSGELSAETISINQE